MSCCGLTRRKALLYGLAMLIGGSITAVLLLVPPLLFPPAVEMVAVPVLREDLPEGTRFTKDNLEELTNGKGFPRAVVAEGYVLKREDLIGKKLTRRVFAREPIRHAELADFGVESSEQSELGLGVESERLTAFGIKPGSRIDVVAVAPTIWHRDVVPLYSNVEVMAIEDFDDHRPQPPHLHRVTFQVDTKYVKLLIMARRRNCAIQVLPHFPDGVPMSPDHIERMLEVLRGLGEFPVAPMPRAKE